MVRDLQVCVCERKKCVLLHVVSGFFFLFRATQVLKLNNTLCELSTGLHGRDSFVLSFVQDYQRCTNTVCLHEQDKSMAT